MRSEHYDLDRDKRNIENVQIMSFRFTFFIRKTLFLSCTFIQPFLYIQELSGFLHLQNVPCQKEWIKNPEYKISILSETDIEKKVEIYKQKILIYTCFKLLQ